MKFVIQEHRAGDRIRYYLRLEKDGLLKGWALPKGMPKEWGKKDLRLVLWIAIVAAVSYGLIRLLKWIL